MVMICGEGTRLDCDVEVRIASRGSPDPRVDPVADPGYLIWASQNTTSFELWYRVGKWNCRRSATLYLNIQRQLLDSCEHK